MKIIKFLSIFFLFSVFTLLFTSPVAAQNTPSNGVSTEDALCVPGSIDILNPSNCVMAGPAQRLADLEKLGLTFPSQPLIAVTPPEELNNIDFVYAKVVNEEVPLYCTLEEAVEGKPCGKLAAGKIKYVSLVQKQETASGTFYQTAKEKWISADVVTKAGVQYFQGIILKQNPSVAFGWINDGEEAVSRKAPGYSAAETGKTYTTHTIVNVYDSRYENDVEWVMIGPDEWIEHRFINRVPLSYEKPQGVETDRWIEINLYEQVMTVHEGNRIVFATLIASGSDPFFTQPGVFTIYKKLENDYMRGAFEADRSDFYYLEDVPYIMYYDQDRALHGAYWHTNFGNMRSHGCVNLSVADSHWLYDWANVGDYVYVWDPSGKTPTDPSFYGAGGF